MKRNILITAALLFFVGFVSLGLTSLRDTHDKLRLKDVQLLERGAELKKLELKYQNLNVELDHTDKQSTERIKQLETEKQQLDQERQRLEGELQAKLQAKEAERVAAANRRNSLVNTLTGTASASAASLPSQGASVGNCGDNMYKQYIYQHESGCNTDRWNSSGCYGIGQACPASKVKDSCGADFTCQDAWFSNYAVQRYGSWEAAYNFWVNNHWW